MDNIPINAVIGGIVAIVGIFFALRNTRFFSLNLRIDKVSAYLAIAFLGIFIMIFEDSKFASAFQVFLILFIAVAVIYATKQTSDIQIMGKREKVLREVNEWALDVGSALMKNGTPDDNPVNIGKEIQERGAPGYIKDRYEVMEDRFNHLIMRSIYIQQISKDTPELKTDIENSIYHLRMKLRLLHVYHRIMEGQTNIKIDLTKAAFNVARNEYRLYSSLVNLTKHIGKLFLGNQQD